MSEWQYQPECRCHYCTQIRSAGTLAGAAQSMNIDHDPAKSLLKPLPPRDSEPHGWKEVQREVAGTSSERAELQVSLLNALSDEIRATNKVNVLILDRVRVLTAQGSLNCERLDRMEAMFERIATEIDHVASRYAEQAETLKTYKLSLEGIQGLLVDLAHSLDVIAEVQANSYDAVVTKVMHIEKRLAQIEERLRTEMEGMRNIVDALGERLEPCKVCAGKRRVHALFERKTLENKAATVDEIMAAHDGRKPRKAGKRKGKK